MEATFDPEEGQEGRIQRTILLWMRTFHPKEGLVHMEEGSVLVEGGSSILKSHRSFSGWQ
ncbi:hypothetical protein ACXR0O_05645 [Verrucomicrobiota bacterium sgz303538]